MDNITKPFIIISVLRSRNRTEGAYDKIFLNTVNAESYEYVKERIIKKYSKGMVKLCKKKHPLYYLAQVSLYSLDSLPSVYTGKVEYIPSIPDESGNFEFVDENQDEDTD